MKEYICVRGRSLTVQSHFKRCNEHVLVKLIIHVFTIDLFFGERIRILCLTRRNGELRKGIFLHFITRA